MSGAPLAMGVSMRGTLVVLLVTLVIAAGRADAGERREFEKHVRTLDPYLRELMREAVAASPSFRTLVARLQRSDVIVYVTREHAMPPLVEGQVTFMAAAGGARYLGVRIARDRPPRRHAAMIAHELQHAVEIADAPWIVDEATLAHEYERAGDHSIPYRGVRTFETRAAILAGERVWREYGANAAD